LQFDITAMSVESSPLLCVHCIMYSYIITIMHQPALPFWRLMHFNYSYNNCENLYSASYSAGWQHFTGRKS